MNILPKKRWHVRTKENIARVRRDEAQAAEQNKINEARIRQAESEARINYLKQRMKEKGHFDESTPEITPSSSNEKPEHVNFFADLEAGKNKSCKTNPEYEKEKKEEQEKYEMQIGYLTYLGKNLNDVAGKVWYEDVPRRQVYAKNDTETSEKSKALLDPIHDIKRYLQIMSSSKDEGNLKDQKKGKYTAKYDNYKKNDIPIKKDKKNKKSKKEKRHKLEKIKPHIDVEKLRAERLIREKTERLRTEALLAKLRGDPLPGTSKETQPKTTVRQKYNSQFFPELARQNAERTPR